MCTHTRQTERKTFNHDRLPFRESLVDIRLHACSTFSPENIARISGRGSRHTFLDPLAFLLVLLEELFFGRVGAVPDGQVLRRGLVASDHAARGSQRHIHNTNTESGTEIGRQGRVYQ